MGIMPFREIDGTTNGLVMASRGKLFQIQGRELAL